MSIQLRTGPLIVLVAWSGWACLPGCGSGSGSHAEAGERTAGTLKLDPGNPKLDFIKVETVQESEAATAITLTGKVAFDEEHTQRVATPIDGRAVQILVRPGDRVSAGQSLITLSSPNVGPLQGDAQKALSDLSVAQKAYERAQKLAADGAISDKEVAQAEGDFKKAKSDVARTSAQLKALGLSASEPATTIALHAQIAGTVVDRAVLNGQEVRADSPNPLLTISNLGSVWVLADVYEQDLGAVASGAPVRVQVPAYPGEWFAGKVGHVGDLVDTTSRTVKIRCVVPNPDGRLKPEMFAKIEIANASKKKVLSIPSRAVINEGDQAKVVVAGEHNNFRARVVQVGPTIDGQVRVLGGIQPGERIVTDGALFLKQEIDSN
jgi:cobalt-zinc-cadmium efflux system membrane fusion protein